MIKRFPTNYLILEGPDLSGKTTFYNRLHKKSSYCWNIQDRSCLSMCIHANQYNRDILQHKLNFDSELLNLNNRFVIMLPPLETLIKRYHNRGDDLQSLSQIKRLHRDFESHAEQLKNFPNVLILRDEDLMNNVDLVHKKIKQFENTDLGGISKLIKDFALNSPNNEATPLSFTLYDSGEFKDADSSIMDYEPEKDYYDQIMSGMLTKIKKEFAGDNCYKLPQDITSRRFVYTNDSCISLIHAIYRDRILDMHFVARSSEVSSTFPYDLKFLFYLSKRVFNELNLNPFEDIVRMRFNLNSGHVLL